MFHQIVAANDDIRKLLDKGYAIAVDSGFLVVRDIPYLNSSRELQTGAIVTKLTFVDNHRIARPDDHQVFFAGSVPHGLDGAPIPNLGGGPASATLQSPDVVVQRSFSNKPLPAQDSGFSNFYEKVESYVALVSGPAMELHQATPHTFRVQDAVVGNSLFKFHDTLTSRAEIGDLAIRLRGEVVAIIGLGGTGSYLLDFMAKSPVGEIRGFDRDPFHVHNAFRSPGRLAEAELGVPKSAVYQDRYASFRNGLTLKATFIDESSRDELRGVTFAFVCVDKGTSRAAIFELLISMGIPFIDVGMGLGRKQGPITGMLRATYYSADHAAATRDRQLAGTADDPDDAYRTQVQIAELNALNACIAVIRYKQLRGFYADDNAFVNLLFDVESLRTHGETFDEAV